MNFVFLILHYCVPEMTIECIETIRKRILGKTYQIVVVDNASPDGSGQTLRKKYSGCSDIHVLLNQENLGFARGNNVGYRYAMQNLHPDFLIIMNNDVLMIQPDFLQRTESLYQRKKFHVLGPDILTPGGERRNPHREKNLTLKDLRRIIRNRTIILMYLRFKRLFHLDGRLHFIEDWDKRRGNAERSRVSRDIPQENIVLQGSCLIFSPDFLRKERIAFCPDTFLWLEEEILSFQCSQKGYRLVYDPAIRVLHKEEVSTKKTQGDADRYLFFSRQLRHSALVMLRLMRKRPVSGRKVQ